MWFSGDCNWMCTHWSTNVPLAPHNTINGGNYKKERINGREIRKRGGEWNSRKECGRFGDSWDCCLLALMVSQEF